jgi:2-dehydro-3-deoxygalactonokinase
MTAHHDIESASRHSRPRLHERYVLGDWGTTRLRLSLYENDVVVDRLDGLGLGAATTPPVDTLAHLVAPWTSTAQQPLEILLCGMAGSRTGLFEVPYAAAPVDSATWCRAVARKQFPGMRVAIAAGLQFSSDDGVADVMRGEETQVFGALRLHPALATGTHLFVLPGTHSKWVEVRDGRVVRFRTALTGELFALLRQHSTLFKTASLEHIDAAETEAGFLAGMQRSAQLTQGLLAALFETRTTQLIERRSATWAAGFLSGLLIGYEIASFSTSYSAADSVTLIGETNLASLYRRVFISRDVLVRVLDGDECAISGLRGLRDWILQEPQ